MFRRLAKITGLVIAGLIALLVLYIVISMIRFSPEYVFRILRWRESSVETYRQLFPTRTVEAPDEPFLFGEASEETPDAVHLFESILETDNLDEFMAGTDTEAFLVIQDDNIIYEGYYNGADQDTLVTSYSVAKSFDTALIGAAIEDGYINSVDDPITKYLPELAERDERFADITIRHVMLMASGLDYQEMKLDLFASDDILSTYYPDQREAALSFIEVADPPGEYFSYNKYHPQLLGLILERTTGMPPAQYLEEKIWKPLGMEHDGSWSLDSEASGFEKMETGVNATARDFAKFGRLYLEGGLWEGEQVLPEEWILESTQVDPETQTDSYYPDEFGQEIYNELDGYYKYMWYGFFREDGGYDFQAEGDRGQFIYVSPHKRIIIVRNGQDWGISSSDWVRAFRDFASQYDSG